MTSTDSAEILTTRLRYDANDELSNLIKAVDVIKSLPAIVERLRAVKSEEAKVRTDELLDALKEVVTASACASAEIDPLVVNSSLMSMAETGLYLRPGSAIANL